LFKKGEAGEDRNAIRYDGSSALINISKTTGGGNGERCNERKKCDVVKKKEHCLVCF